MYDIKCENGNICRTCLSSDRRLSPLANYDLYFTLLNENKQTVDRGVILVCWECAATMRRMTKFQVQALKANKVLAESLESIINESLSHLSIFEKNYYDAVFEESDDVDHVLADKLVLCDSVIKEEKSEFIEFNKQYIKEYNMDIDEGGVLRDDDNFETKGIDISSHEENARSSEERITYEYVTAPKRKHESDDTVAPINSQFEFKSLSSDPLLKRRSTRLRVNNSVKTTNERFKTGKEANGRNVKRKIKTKKITTSQIESKTKNTEIDKKHLEDNVSNKSETEFVSDHIEDSDECSIDNSEFDKNTSKSNGSECSERKIDIIENTAVQEVSDSLDIAERKDRKSLRSDSSVDDNDSEDNLDIEESKNDQRARKRRKRRIQQNLQTVVVRYNYEELDAYFNKVEVSDDMVTEVLGKEPTYTTKAMPHGCEYCGTCFQHLRTLTHHIRSRHMQLKKAMKCTDPTSPDYYRYSIYSCTLCEKVMRKEHTEAHMKYMHRFKYVCLECDEVFWDKTAAQAHSQTSHTRFVCKICNKVKTKRKYLDKHMHTWHTACACAECGARFPALRALRRHREAAHPDCSAELRYCVQCDVQFRSLFAYSAHLRYTKAHRPGRAESFPCPTCGKVLMTKFAMQCHHDRFHGERTRFQCSHCGKYFARQNGLQAHVAAAHLKLPKTKDKVCSFCGRAFSTNRVLVHHIRTHTGERPHQCAHCPAAFAQPYPLRKHISTVHRDIASQATAGPNDASARIVPNNEVNVASTS